MGKLRDLKDQRDDMDWEHPDRAKVEKEINGIEQWCIDNGNKYVTKLTTWRKGQGKKIPFAFNEANGFVNGTFEWIKVDKVIKHHYICGKCGDEVLKFILYTYCVTCQEKNQITYVHGENWRKP